MMKMMMMKVMNVGSIVMVSFKRPQEKTSRTVIKGHSLSGLPPPSSAIPNSRCIERELERCRAEIERLSCEITKSSNNKLIQKINVGRKKCESQMSVASQVKHGHELLRGRSPLPRSLQQERIIRGKASADGRQLVKTSRISELSI